MRLDGKVALITGAAAGVKGELMGFGGAAAWLFAGEGAKLVLADINEDAGQRTAEQLRAQGCADVVFTRLDVTNEDDWRAAVRLALDTYGRLDILVNNAGTSDRARVEETDEARWDGQMSVHAKGAFLGMKHAIPEMRKAGGGSIINVSSIYGLVGSRTSTAYHAAKGAVRILSKSAAIQYAGDNIRVNSIHPGFCATPMTAVSQSDPENRRQTLDRIPMGRLGEPEEVAQGMLYLASDDSAYVTGAELVIDGGVTAT